MRFLSFHCALNCSLRCFSLLSSLSTVLRVLRVNWRSTMAPTTASLLTLSLSSAQRQSDLASGSFWLKGDHQLSWHQFSRMTPNFDFHRQILFIFLHFWPHLGPIWVETLCFTRGLARFDSKMRQIAKFDKTAKITKWSIPEIHPFLFLISWA